MSPSSSKRLAVLDWVSSWESSWSSVTALVTSSVLSADITSSSCSYVVAGRAGHGLRRLQPPQLRPRQRRQRLKSSFHPTAAGGPSQHGAPPAPLQRVNPA